MPLIKEVLPNKSKPALLKAEIELNKFIQRASGIVRPVAFKYPGSRKIGKPNTNPSASMIITIKITRETYLLTCDTVLLFTACDKNNRSLNFNFLVKIETIKAKIVINPRPPI